MTQSILIRKEPRVLIIEDEPRLRELLSRAIAGWGFETATARSGEESLRVMAESPCDIALLDLNLPGMSGLECLERLRTQAPHLQSIVLTGFASLEAAQKAIHLDVVEFLTKPCHLGELERALDRAIRRLPALEPALPSLDDDPNEPTPASHSGVKLEDVERQHILDMLQRNGGNRTATAIELGISRRTLYYKLGEYQRQGFTIG